MSRKVKVTYISRNHRTKEAVGVETEINLLIEADDRTFVIGTKQDVDLTMLSQPGNYLLEDDYGLWYLPYEDCLEMEYLDD
jgi:hypothetical protein